jgi:hypothetical protein
MTISNSSGDSFSVVHKRNYNASFVGGLACGDNMPKAFAPTVQELITKIITHPEFSLLFGNGKNK